MYRTPSHAAREALERWGPFVAARSTRLRNRPLANQYAGARSLCRTKRASSAVVRCFPLPFVLRHVRSSVLRLMDRINSPSSPRSHGCAHWVVPLRLAPGALRYHHMVRFAEAAATATPAGFNGSMFSGHYGHQMLGKTGVQSGRRYCSSVVLSYTRAGADVLSLHGHVSMDSHVALLQWLVDRSTPRI